MSLVGSLEDLGLGDLLQIVHLANKSGVLRVRGDAGEGQISFRKGMIRAAHAKGGPTHLRELLAARRVIAGPLLEGAWLEAHHSGRRLADVLVERELVELAAIDALRREQIESAVLAMFSWPSGEFSFEMRELLDDGAELALDPGVNPQFLVLEGTRRVDEQAHETGQACADEAKSLADIAELDAELVFDESEGEPAAFAHAAPAATREASATPPPVVVIDPSLAVLEWAKAALGADFPRVHVFQRPSLGIDRIRQYLARADIPLVVVAEDTPPDSASGARDANEIVVRLKRQASAMPVLLLCDESSVATGSRRTRADGIVVRPPAALLADPRSGRERTRIATLLAETLAALVAPAAPPPPEPAVIVKESSSDPSDTSLRPRVASARIRDGAGRGEVLSQLLAYAAECFGRVALFGVRGDRVMGVAQAGLARAGGPDDAGLRELTLGSREPAWFRCALETKHPLRAAPSDNGDHRLAVLLGNEIPVEAFVAPIVTGERVAALLYADNLPGGEPFGDTRELELLLDAAGVALERALAERTQSRTET